MLSLPLYAGFIAAAVLVLIIPGPNIAFIVSNSLAHGRKSGLLTVAGTSSAMVLQLGLTVLGMTALLTAMAGVFDWLRWAGVLYLIYLGCRIWNAKPQDLSTTRPDPHSAAAIYLRGLLVSLTNPKTLLFFGAFLPQFADAGRPLLPQLLIFSASFLGLAIVLDSAWAILAGQLRFMLGSGGRLRNRIAGGCYIGAGLGLALARKP
jgi:threonine/homoserine/homoserine lactone efflux protein